MVKFLFYRLKHFRDPKCHLQFRPGTSVGSRTAWILSYTPVCTEPRVLRQARALVDAGWRVVVFGYPGRTDVPSEWHYGQLAQFAPYALHVRYILKIFRGLGLVLARFGVKPGLRQAGARLYHRCVPSTSWNRKQIRAFADEHHELLPALVISHDYFTADAGLDVARRAGAKFAIDCHEYARGQYMHDPHWVKWLRNYVWTIQDYYLSQADMVTTVCDGIADLLNEEQQLKRPVRVVRSVPFRNMQPLRPTADRIVVLYLGEVYYNRGLHKAIKSMPLWRPEFEFVMQGNVDPTYAESLRRIAAQCGVADRVHFRPPVPFDQIVPSANEADIGYFVHKDTSPQKRFVLPNKYFEYVMAGLALCVSDLPEMARLVRKYEFGKLVHAYDEQAIATVINSFTRPEIDRMKEKSILAAQELNWENEQRVMLTFYDECLTT